MENVDIEKEFIDGWQTVELHLKKEEGEKGERICYWYEGTLPDEELDDIKISIDLSDETIKILFIENEYMIVSRNTLELMNKIMSFMNSIEEKIKSDSNYIPPEIKRINFNTPL